MDPSILDVSINSGGAQAAARNCCSIKSGCYPTLSGGQTKIPRDIDSVVSSSPQQMREYS